ncbi:unnamed protein product [Rotaria socialis]|uniref:Uncharacterized protein n=1 Tax=Rotaria socialis TaxID=392032 RepID=A0A817TIK6_9BILA|nr:unnamed protein product [Rotaria socialis]CAF4395525.1 unnamed protein product [Rotaria socialis]
MQKLFIDHSKTAITLPSMYPDQQLSKQWIDLLIESQNNSLLLEYIDRVNNELVTSMTDEIEVFYKYVFHYIHKIIQPLDYFTNKLSVYISVLSNLSPWPILVQMIFFNQPNSMSEHTIQTTSETVWQVR